VHSTALTTGTDSASLPRLINPDSTRLFSKDEHCRLTCLEALHPPLNLFIPTRRESVRHYAGTDPNLL